MSLTPKRQMILDFIGWNLIVLSFICFLYVATVQKSVGMAIIVPICMVFGGVLFGYATKSLTTDTHMDRKELSDSTLWFIISFGIIITIQVGVVTILSHLPFNVSFDVMDLKIYGVLLAIAEEVCFRGFFLPWFSNIVPVLGPYFGVPASAGAWTIFHAAVYGTQPIAMIIVFMCGIALGFIAWSKKRLWIFMGAHALVNLMALGGFHVIGTIVPVVLISVVVVLWATRGRQR